MDRRTAASITAAVLGLLPSAACGRAVEEAAAQDGRRPAVALLLPESKTARYETQDRPGFGRRVRELCPTCRLLYANANQDASVQLSQAEAALSNGADVLVLDPVDSSAASAIVVKAKGAGVPVVSYDRLVLDADVDYYVSFDNERVGEFQGRALLDRLRELGRDQGSIVMINGSPTDSNAAQFKRGAHRVLDGSGVRIGAEYDTPDWSPDRAQQQMEQAITRLGRGAVAGVYAANDGTAGGALAAMKAAGFGDVPPVTGQDAELAAVQRILAGEQYMTIYKAIAPEAEAAAELAVALARRSPIPAELVNAYVDNGFRRVPSVLLAPVVVRQETVKATVMADGFWSAAQVCAGRFADACRRAGIR
jgi:D-xylose transport system substrate-binding protein